jgi:diamine N-acetyltransferase
VLIREASIDDAAAICALLEQVDAFHAVARPELYRAPQPALRTAAFIQTLLTNPTHTLFIAQREGDLAGVALMITRNAPELPIFVPRRFAVVETLAVAEAARRQGVGRALMQHIQHWATEQNLDEVQVVGARAQHGGQSLLCRTRL